MTATQAQPLPRTSPPAPAEHEHAWRTESRHRTSEGAVLYVRCDLCDARRIDLQTCPDTPPRALTKPISAVGNNR